MLELLSVSSVRICFKDFLARSKWYYCYLNSSFLLFMSSSSSWCSWWRFCMCALLLFFIFSNSSLISPLHVIYKNEIINHFRVPKTLTFKTGLKYKTFLIKMSFKCMRTKTHLVCYLLVEVNFSWCFKNVACSNLNMKKYLLEWWTILGLAVPRKHISG